MEARNIPSAGEPVLIRELAMSSQWFQRSISVIGRLEEHNVGQCQATLVDPKSHRCVTVDTTLVEPFQARLRGLFQFIGETRQPTRKEETTHVVLQARVVRCVDGLDLTMYEQALRVQREYLDSRIEQT